ncbi:CAP domain-containing protein [Sphingomonas caeni]|uniref:CAP domain-containing protein n=1 Tax=Sphingomonas caeni TaxID=2984949 RepID=UPI0022326412|nr:CAP domain-containing protein [Sphingomonas caeni]
MRKLVPLLLASFAVACSGGSGSLESGGGGGGVIVTPTPTPTPTPGATPTPTPSSTEPANGSEFFGSIATLYSVQPDLSICRAGILKPEVGQRVLAVLNNIRAFHRLPPVAYATAEEADEMQSALMQAANGALSHTPPTSWNCYTAAGANASAQSNLYIGLGSGLSYTRNDDIVIGWLTDVDNLVLNSVGHRRWLLYPFLSTIAYGRVAGRYQLSNKADASALKVINTSQATPASLPDFVAYPYEDYPARYFANGALFSFGVLANKNSAFGTNATVNFSAATITVRERGAGTLAVSQIAFDNDGFGLPNNLQWKVTGLKTNTFYDVTIANVGVNGSARSYTYFFRIIP